MLNRRSFVASSGAILVASALARPALAAPLSEILISAQAGTAVPAVGALVIQQGKVTEIGVSGLRHIGEPERVQADDTWLIGSCTKPMTVTLIARLVDRQLLSWTAPLSAMMPDLMQNMRPEYRSVTLIQLLSHRSGLGIGDEKLGNRFFSDTRALPEQRLAFATLGLQQPPVAAPGTEFHYSNIGFVVAAAIAERVTGASYENLMHNEVFEHLGMLSAGFGPPHQGGISGHVNGRAAARTDSAPPLFGPTGFVHVSLNDWAKFCLDQLAGAKGRGRMLSAASYRLMQSALPGADEGLGWGIDATIRGRKGPVLEHTGSEGNWYAMMILFPDSGDGILAVANAGSSMGGDKATFAALKAVLPKLSTPA